MAERNCPRCTLFNPADATNCAACDMKLPPAPAAPLSPLSRPAARTSRILTPCRWRRWTSTRSPRRRWPCRRRPTTGGRASSAPVAVPPPPTFDTAPETAARDVGSFDAGFGADFSAFESAPAGAAARAADEGFAPAADEDCAGRRFCRFSGAPGAPAAVEPEDRFAAFDALQEPEPEPEPVPGPDEDPGFAAFDVDEAPLAAPVATPRRQRKLTTVDSLRSRQHRRRRQTPGFCGDQAPLPTESMGALRSTRRHWRAPSPNRPCGAGGT